MTEYKSWLASFVGTGLDWCGVLAACATVVLILLKVTGTLVCSWWVVAAPTIVLGIIVVGLYVWVAIEAMRGRL